MFIVKYITVHVHYKILHRMVNTQLQANTDKSVQLSVVHSMIVKRFPTSNVSVTAVSHLIQDVFPNARLKQCAKERALFVVDIELKHPSGMVSSLPVPVMDSSAFQPSTSSLSEGTQITELLLELERERELRVALEYEVETLKRKIQAGSDAESAEEYQQQLHSEIDSVVCSRQMQHVRHGPDTVEHFNEFSMSNVIAELQASCPHVYKLIQQLGTTMRNANDGEVSGEERKGVMAICTLLNARSARVKGMQLMVSLMLVARGAGRQVYMYTYIRTNMHSNDVKYTIVHFQAMTLLNHAGVCMSYSATWEHLLDLTQQANLLSKIQSGHWILAYDNLNVHCSIRHERQGDLYGNAYNVRTCTHTSTCTILKQNYIHTCIILCI